MPRFVVQSVSMKARHEHTTVGKVLIGINKLHAGLTRTN